MRRIFLFPAYIHQLPDQACALFSGGSDFFYLSCQRVRSRDFALHQIAVKQDPGEQIVEVVGDTADQAANQRQALRVCYRGSRPPRQQQQLATISTEFSFLPDVIQILLWEVLSPAINLPESTISVDKSVVGGDRNCIRVCFQCGSQQGRGCRTFCVLLISETA